MDNVFKPEFKNYSFRLRILKWSFSTSKMILQTRTSLNGFRPEESPMGSSGRMRGAGHHLSLPSGRENWQCKY